LLHAHGIAWLEERIRQRPSAWGDDLQVVIYADFKRPRSIINIPSLGIMVYPENLTNAVIRNVMSFLKAIAQQGQA
jgi:hypothetical protein